MCVVQSVTSDMTRRAVQVPAALVAAVLFLSSCSSDDSSSSATPSSSQSPSETSPSGVALTDQGTRLDFGESATVAHRQAGEEGVLKLTVDSATKGSIKDLTGYDLDTPYKRRGSYYYVDVSVANKGTTTVGGIPVPLWGLSGDNTLLQPVIFPNRFAKCPTKNLPKKFKPGDKLKTCLVFLSPNHGSLKGASYRPSESFLPIEWHGTVDTDNKAKHGKGKHQKGKSEKGKPKKGQS